MESTVAEETEDKSDSETHKLASTSEDTKDDESNKAKDEGEANKKRKIGCNNDEVLAVLGHELGHWALNHTVKNMVISQVCSFTV